MENELSLKDDNINPIFEEIKVLINDSRNRVYSVVNVEMLNLYWNIGRIIMEIQQGDERASYGNAVLDKLSKKLELIKIDEENKRNFYLNEAINSRWSVRELQRQIGALLYERILLSKDKKIVPELSKKGQVLKTSRDLVKDPFVLEFLDIKENTDYLESDFNESIFASEYKLHLPTEQDLINAIEEEKKNLQLKE